MVQCLRNMGNRSPTPVFPVMSCKAFPTRRQERQRKSQAGNGSFCHTDAVSAGTIGTTQNYCDDDYEDTDGDGLADWQELLGTFGWFSNPAIADTDNDGVNDFDEVQANTDPTNRVPTSSTMTTMV